MEQQIAHKTFTYQLIPTPNQERTLAEVVWRCRDLYTAALQQRLTAYQRRHVSISRFEQEAELKDIRAEFGEYAAIYSHILQDALVRLDKTYQAFYRRAQRGEKAGFPRFKGRNRSHSCACKEYGNGARLDIGSTSARQRKPAHCQFPNVRRRGRRRRRPCHRSTGRLLRACQERWRGGWAVLAVGDPFSDAPSNYLERLFRPDEDGPLTDQQRQAVLANTYACAPSFEAFVYRWWLEAT